MLSNESDSQRRLQQQQPASSDVSTTPGDGLNSATDLLNTDSQQLTVDAVDTTAGDKKPDLGPPVMNHASAAEPLIVHAGAIVSMLHLLPSIACQQQPEVINTYLLTLKMWDSSSSGSMQQWIV